MVEEEGREIRRKVVPGMMCHIPADIYHETINTGWETFRIIAIYCPTGPEALLRSLPGSRIVPPRSQSIQN